MPKPVLIAYVPALHQGYYQLFQKHSQVEVCYLLGPEFIAEFPHLRKELRALSPELACQAVAGWQLFERVQVLDHQAMQQVQSSGAPIVMPDEDVSRQLAEKYFGNHQIAFEPVFLRWDRRRSDAKDPARPDRIVSHDQFDREMVKLAHTESRHSSNIWRRVGALIVKDGQVWSKASNRHQPSDHSPWIDGDVRGNYQRGVGIEMSTDMHAEAILIAQAAARGVALKGTSLYVSTFPCPPCAMLIAHSGIKSCYYAAGYAVLDGERVLKDNGVELIKVDVELPPDRDDVYRPYPEK